MPFFEKIKLSTHWTTTYASSMHRNNNRKGRSATIVDCVSTIVEIHVLPFIYLHLFDLQKIINFHIGRRLSAVKTFDRVISAFQRIIKHKSCYKRHSYQTTDNEYYYTLSDNTTNWTVDVRYRKKKWGKCQFIKRCEVAK